MSSRSTIALEMGATPKPESKKDGRDELTRRLSVRFHQIDVDGNGRLSRDEVRNALQNDFGVRVTDAELGELWDRYDKNKNGGLDQDEFVAMALEIQEGKLTGALGKKMRTMINVGTLLKHPKKTIFGLSLTTVAIILIVTLGVAGGTAAAVAASSADDDAREEILLGAEVKTELSNAAAPLHINVLPVPADDDDEGSGAKGGADNRKAPHPLLHRNMQRSVKSDTEVVINDDGDRVPVDSDFATHSSSKRVNEDAADAAQFIDMVGCYLALAGQEDALSQSYDRARADGSLKAWDGVISYTVTFDASVCEQGGDGNPHIVNWAIEASMPNSFCDSCTQQRTTYSWLVTDLDQQLKIHVSARLNDDGTVQSRDVQWYNDDGAANSNDIQYASFGYLKIVPGANEHVVAKLWQNDINQGRTASRSLHYEGDDMRGKAVSHMSDFGSSVNRYRLAYDQSLGDGVALRIKAPTQAHSTTSETCIDINGDSALQLRKPWRYNVYDTNGRRVSLKTSVDIETRDNANNGEKPFRGHMSSEHISCWQRGCTDTRGDSYNTDDFQFLPGMQVYELDYDNQAAGGVLRRNATIQASTHRLSRTRRDSSTLGEFSGVPLRVWNRTGSVVVIFDAQSQSFLKIQERKQYCVQGSDDDIQGYTEGACSGQSNSYDESRFGDVNPPTPVLFVYDHTDTHVCTFDHSLCGELQIRSNNAFKTPTADTPIVFNLHVTIRPRDSSVPTSLACVENCPIGGTTSEMYPTSGDIEASTGLGSAIWNYTWDPQAYVLVDDTNGLVVNSTLHARLFDASSVDTNAIKCNWDSNIFCLWKINEVANEIFYYESHGIYSLVRDDDGSVLHFDEEMFLTYQHDSTSLDVDLIDGYDYSGTTWFLRYGGHGVYGLPERCISKHNFEPIEACIANYNDKIYVSDIQIPDGARVFNVKTGDRYYIKAGEIEVFYMPIDDDNCTAFDADSAGFASSFPAFLDSTEYSVPESIGFTIICPRNAQKFENGRLVSFAATQAEEVGCTRDTSYRRPEPQDTNAAGCPQSCPRWSQGNGLCETACNVAACNSDTPQGGDPLTETDCNGLDF